MTLLSNGDTSLFPFQFNETDILVYITFLGDLVETKGLQKS